MDIEQIIAMERGGEDHLLMRLADQRTSRVIRVFSESANPDKPVRDQIRSITDDMIHTLKNLCVQRQWEMGKEERP